MIEFKSVSKKFKNKKVINDLNLKVKKGELVCLIGKSGCGKTTTLKMINRLVEPTSGSILINGVDTISSDKIALRRQMGYVIQQTGLFPHMTVKENIEIIPKLQKIDKAELSDKTDAMLSTMGLTKDVLNRYPADLSGGQQQRVGIARAFINDPEIILMDEPFSALDPITKEILHRELIELYRRFNKTIVFVTHDMDEAIKISDKVCIMESGRVIQYDTPEEILKNPYNGFVETFVGKNRLWSSPELIRAVDVMITKPLTCRLDSSLGECLNIMVEGSADYIVIIDHLNNFKGMLTAKYAALKENAAENVTEFMRSDVEQIDENSNLVDVIKAMQKSGFSHIPVLNQNNRVTGVITKNSLFNTLSKRYTEED